MAKPTINRSAIITLRESGKTAEEICEELKIKMSEYKEICKIFKIKGKVKISVNSKFELVDDSENKEA